MIQFTYSQVSGIVEKSRNDIESNSEYQMLFRRFFQRLWDDQLNHQILFSIAISPEDVTNMQFENLQDKLEEVNKRIAESNYFKINSVGDIVDNKYLEGDSASIRKCLERYSEQDYLFFFGEQGITRYINGRAVEEENYFYSRSDRMRYREKKDISKIQEVMDDYAREYVTKQVNYMCFFADNSCLSQIDKELINRNILKNRPEHYMRDQLCQYLTDNMRYTFTIEPELEQSKRELDIYFDVSGELYFIEIKWVGCSLNDKGTDISTTYTDKRVREGVIQTLEYIQELMNSWEKSLRHGYLVVYDARDDKKDELCYKDYDSYVKQANPSLMSYLKYYSMLKIIPLEKRHPA